MTTPNISLDIDMMLPETSIFTPAKVKFEDPATGMPVKQGRKATDTLVWVPQGVLLVNMQLEMSGGAGLVSVGITQNGKRQSVIWLNNPKTGFYTGRVIIDDPKARLYVIQEKFTTSALNGSKVGVTVIPTGILPKK